MTEDFPSAIAANQIQRWQQDSILEVIRLYSYIYLLEHTLVHE